MSTIHRWHFEQLRAGQKIAAYIVQISDPRDMVTYRDGGQGWTAAEVIGHLLDCERLFLERARLTVTQNCPMLHWGGQDEDVTRGRYNEWDMQTLLDTWRAAREDYLGYLSTVPEEAWAREGQHPTYPPFSLDDQLFLACWHEQNHIEQMTRILSEKINPGGG
jgi:uncharacterized damage-inducible protein DinB